LQAARGGIEGLFDDGTRISALHGSGPGREIELRQIGTGTKTATCAGDEPWRLMVWIGFSLVQCGPQVVVHLAREAVQGLGPIQGDQRNGAAFFEGH
jgi:hypothetical protein